MEFLIGTLVAFAGMFFIRKKIVPNLIVKPKKIKTSQSVLFNLTKDLIPPSQTFFAPRAKTQSSEYEKKNTTRIIYIDNQAWWIESGLLTVANINEDGEIDFETKKGVDTMTMDKVQLDKTIFIVEKLTEGL